MVNSSRSICGCQRQGSPRTVEKISHKAINHMTPATIIQTVMVCGSGIRNSVGMTSPQNMPTRTITLNTTVVNGRLACSNVLSTASVGIINSG